jgi:hypothetical protein
MLLEHGSLNENAALKTSGRHLYLYHEKEMKPVGEGNEVCE